MTKFESDLQQSLQEEQDEILAEANGFLVQQTEEAVSFITRAHIQHSSVFGEMSLIVPGLYLGSAYNAYSAEQLRKNNVTYILNCCSETMDYSHDNIKNLVIPVKYNSLDQFPKLLQAARIIAKLLENGQSILVHCMRGRSRSVGVVLCYLIYSRNMDAGAALIHVKKSRPIVDPTRGICCQVADFQQRLPAFLVEESNVSQLVH